NMQLNMSREDLDQVGIVPGTRFEVEVAGERYYATAARTYADARPGEIVLYEDSYRNVAIAINRGNAAEMFSAHQGQRVLLHVEGPCRLGNASRASPPTWSSAVPGSGVCSAGRCSASSIASRRGGTRCAARIRSRRSAPRSTSSRRAHGVCSTSARAPAR